MKRRNGSTPGAPIRKLLSRRWFLKAAGTGTAALGANWLTGRELLGDESQANVSDSDPAPPEVLIQGLETHPLSRYSNPARLSDGTLIRYGINGREHRLYSQTSSDGGRTWGRSG